MSGYHLLNPAPPGFDEADFFADAACAEPDVDPDLFFGHEGEMSDQRARRVRAAKAVCAGCPVLLECRGWARRHRLPAGVWGGETAYERGTGGTRAA